MGHKQKKKNIHWVIAYTKKNIIFRLNKTDLTRAIDPTKDHNSSHNSRLTPTQNTSWDILPQNVLLSTLISSYPPSAVPAPSTHNTSHASSKFQNNRERPGAEECIEHWR